MQCPRCEREIESDWLFCRWCGAGLAAPVQETGQHPDGSPERSETSDISSGGSASAGVEATESPLSPSEASGSLISTIVAAPIPPGNGDGIGVGAAAPVAAVDPTGAPRREDALVAQAPPAHRRSRSPLMLAAWAIALLALAGSILAVLSRASVAHQLDSTKRELSFTKSDLASSRAELVTTKQQLTDIQTQAEGLDKQVDSLSADNRKAESDLTESRAKNTTLQGKVEACQTVINISVDVGNAGNITDAQGAKLTSSILKCYGRFPSFLSGG